MWSLADPSPEHLSDVQDFDEGQVAPLLNQ